jgi:hypothetical protein
MRTLAGIFLASSFCFTLAACGMEGDEASVVEFRAKDKVACGGLAGLTCPGEQFCIDDPSDDCSPNRGGADCIGMCVGKPTSNSKNDCNKGDQSYTYVANSPEECAVIKFICAEGSSYFADDCGCGCVDDAAACDDDSDPTLDYVATLEECAYTTFLCPKGTHHFSDDCGCGCEDDAACDYDSDPNLTYVGMSPDECAVIKFFCEAGSQYFANECGCGCEAV